MRDLVVSGNVAIGITDTDDAHAAIRNGAPIRLVFPDQRSPFPGDEPLGAFFIPNTVALVRGGPHPEAGKKLVNYLLSAEVEGRLVASGFAQVPVRPSLDVPGALEAPADLRLMEIRYEEAERGLEEARPFLRRLFLSQ